MIELRIDVTTNVVEIIKQMDRLQSELGNMLVPMQAIERAMPTLLAERFSGFQKHAWTYKTASYELKKAETGGRVGVKTGRLLKGISDGSALDADYVPFGEAANANLTIGLNLSGFEHGYPKYFAKWLEERGDDLMAIEPEQIDDLVEEFGFRLSWLVDGALK